MREIPLTQGQVALVNDEDFEELNKYSWQAFWSEKAKAFYAKRGGGFQMHRQIMAVTDPKIHVDHWDHNTLNNQRHNLRPCTCNQNQYNKRKYPSSSIYKGVTWFKRTRRWQAYIRTPILSGRGIKKHLGYFSDEVEAARAYDSAAREYFGEFALLNFPE